MKREFLQNFKVGDQPLTKEIIDAIMEENGYETRKQAFLVLICINLFLKIQ